MRRHELLRHLHEQLRPRTYLEVGVSTGSSMQLSRTRSLGVDPAFTIKREVQCDLRLVRAASDEFFAGPDPMAHFEGRPVDLAFVDGMHLAEYALRDVINVERHTAATSVLVLDDMLPRHVDEAARDRAYGRARGAWAGDVYKVAGYLRELRPDLVVLEVDTAPTGVVLVLCPDAGSRVLLDAYDALVAQIVTPDPQDVPASVLERTRALAPEAVAASTMWAELARLRDASAGSDEVRRAVEDSGLLAAASS